MQHITTTTTGRRGRKARRSGFSMIEMVLVLVIVGILVAISVPKMARTIRHERVNRTRERLLLLGNADFG